MKLSQIIERNKRHASDPYIFLLEAALPSGVTLRFARDRQSWVWPMTGSSHADFTFPADVCDFTTANNLTVCLQGRWRGSIVLERQNADGTWTEITSYLQRTEENVAVDAGACRLRAGADFRGAASVHLGDASMPLWQSMSFDFEDFKSGEGARRGTLTVSVSNASGLALNYVDELEDWRKQNGRYSVKCRFLVVNAGQLDDAEPVMQLAFTDTAISCPAPMDKVSFTLGARNIWSWTLHRKIMQQYCSWKRKADCIYVAACDHTLTSCRDIYHNTLNFGGFPMMGRGALYGGA